ncbi:MAG: transcription termination factor NusA [Anaerolineae bacterium]|nr:transcription termination factor NusA [Anaerolineae bacterium]
MANELQLAFNEIAEMRMLPAEVVLEALQTALVSAYRRDSNASAAQAIEARIDPSTGRARIFVEKEVCDDVQFASTEVTLEKARFYNPEAQIGDMVMVQVESTTKKFGRIAAQTAKQVILQKIREAERNSLYEEYIGREGDIITGTVQNINQNFVTLSLGRAEAKLPRPHQIPGERYRQHEKLRVYVVEVKRTNRGPEITCSRSHRNMLRRLLEYEVPEIYNGQVEIKSIAREAGYRSKVAVAALQDGIDPVGACVGMRGIRIQNIVKELHDEKIDVIEWNPDPVVFITKALSPARVAGVYLEDDIHTGKTAVVLVQDEQLSLAIGREGQNARLAAKLTGWRIDIKSVSETVQSALENLDMPPLSGLTRTHAQLIEDVQRIIEKKLGNRAVMPEEYNLLSKFADLVERRLLIEREEERQEHLQQVAAVKATLPQELFEAPLKLLRLPDELLEALESMGNIGAVMLATLVDEERLKKLLTKLPGQPLQDVQTALDELMETTTDFSQLIHGTAPAAVEHQTDDVPAAHSPAATATAAAPARPPVDDDDEVVLDAFGGVVAPTPTGAATAEAIAASPAGAEAGEDFDFEEDDELTPAGDEPARKKAAAKVQNKRRQLVFDEESGEVVAKRRRKGNRKGRDSWNDYEF